VNLCFGTDFAINSAEDILMNTNKSLHSKIKDFGIAFSLLFSFMLLLGMNANAQMFPQDRREDRQERREDRRDARQDGYRDGVKEGREDARDRRSFNPQGNSDYRRAGGEDTQRERQAYRTGFLQGYRDGYYRNNRNGNWNNGIMRQGVIQTRVVRVGGRLYRETYRTIYFRNGSSQTQLISRVRVR